MINGLSKASTDSLFVVSIPFHQRSETSEEMRKFVAVWENRFLEQVKLCSERIPGKSIITLERLSMTFMANSKY